MTSIASRLHHVRRTSVHGLAAALLALAWAGTAGAQTWTPVAPSPYNLTDHSATLLLDGRVLTVGGDGPPLLFDPRSGTWSPTVGAPEDLTRYRAGGVLLGDGRVLITGGGVPASTTSLGSTWLFDPRTNGWTPAASLSVPRLEAAIARLPDGRVLVAGGRRSFGDTPSEIPTEIYDPAADVWAPTGSMSTARIASSLTPLPDGRLLICGGNLAGTSAEIYDPASGLFIPAAPMSGERSHTTGLLLPTGQVLVVGDGVAGGAPATTPELYDPVANTWTPAPAPPLVTLLPSLALLPDGRVLMVGNAGAPASQIYDPVAGTWTAGPAFNNIGRFSPTLTVLPDGRVLMIGGGASADPAAEIFDARTVATQPAETGLGARWNAASVLLADGRVLVTGGVGPGFAELASGAVYNPAADSWQPTPSMSTSRINGHDAILLRDGRAMVLGGATAGNGAAIDIYDPALNTWHAGTPMSSRRAAGGTVVLSNGWVLVCGGESNLGPTDAAELYIPEIDRWLPIAPMPGPRWRMGAVRLADDRVLVAGGVGIGGGNVRAEAWIYDYRTNTWTPTGSLSRGHQDAQARLLPDGRVLLISSFTSGGVTTISEIWNPTTGVWTIVPLAGTPIVDPAVVTLPSGEVAVVSGALISNTTVNEIKVFDPATTTWRVAGNITTGRRDPEAVLLPDGRLLVVGGMSAGFNATESPELVSMTRGRDSSRVPALSPIGALVNSEAPTMNGTGFAPVHAGGASMFTRSSASNYPFVRYRSLATGDQAFLPLEAWTDTSAALTTLAGRSLGPALVDVRVNGIASNPRLTTVDAASTTIQLNNVSALYSTVDRTIAVGSRVESPVTPIGGGVTLVFVTTSGGALVGQLALSPAVPSDGHATASWVVPAGTNIGSYTLTVVYSGDALHEPAAASGQLQIGPVPTMLTLTPNPATVERGGTVPVAASAVPVEGAVVAGTIEITNGEDACTIVAPSGTCDLTFSQAGLATISATFTPATPGTHLASSAQTSIQVTCPELTLTPASLPNGRVDQPYSVVFSASGGMAPYTFAIAGALPPGLAFNGDTLSGTPTGPFNGSVTVRATESGGACSTELTLPLTIEPTLPVAREYTLAEGVTNGFFASFILIANPNAADAPITLTYAGAGGATANETRTLAPFSRVTIPTGAGSIAEGVGQLFATRVTSETGLALLVERSTYFDAMLHAGDLSAATGEGGSTTWHFAEGTNGYFHTYLALGNFSADEAATVTVRYFPEGGAPVERQYIVGPNSRATIDTFVDPALTSTAFAMSLQSSLPIAADRVQYFGSPFIGGHADGGARELSHDWYFAEGATGSAFDTYLLLANPAAEAANVTVTYHTDLGEAIARSYVLPGGARRTIGVEGEDARLAFTTFWTEVHADRPIVAERAMYIVQGGAWTDATATTGARAPGLRWGLAEGIVGMALRYMPYVLVANPGLQPAEITVQYLRSSGAPVSHSYTIPAQGRLTLDVRAEEPSLIDSEFGIVVSSTNNTPIVVERSQYWTSGGPGFVGAMNTMGTPLEAPPQP